jgi:hypothetical protein
MGLNINTDREIRTVDELTDLVREVVGAPVDTQETRWIEWKSTLDLDKAAGRFTVGKAILGFANRSPEVAARTCKGAAYLVVGAEPGGAVGVNPVDHAILAQKIKSYADGPRWTPYYIDHSGVKVLVIAVAPPRNGDPIYVLQTTFDKAEAGTVFHRGPGLTERAGPNEMAMLQERFIRGVQTPDLDIELSVEAQPLIRIDTDVATLRDWLDRREKYIRANCKPRGSTPNPDNPGFIGAHVFANAFANPKDAQEFEGRVQDHMNKCDARLLRNILREIAISQENKVTAVVANHTDDPIERVQLTVFLQSRAILAYSGAPSETPMPELPRWPDAFDSLHRGYQPLSGMYSPDDLAGVGYAAVTTREDGVELTFNIGDMRPGEVVEAQPITVIAANPTPEQIPVTLTASSMNRRGKKTKSTTFEVSPRKWSPDRWIVAEWGYA